MKHLAALLCLLLLACFAAPACASLYDAGYVCNPDPADRLNLRAKPSTSAVSLGKFYNGTPVIVQSIDGDWAKVTICGALSGYMHTDYLAFEPTPSAIPIVTITAPGGKQVLSSMRPDEKESVWFPMGMQLEVMGVMEDWLFVRSGESIVGFMENSGTTPRVYFSTPDTTPPARISLIATPTPSPTPVPTPQTTLVNVPVEGARKVTQDDWIIFAAPSAPTMIYADKALTQPINTLEMGEFFRTLNDIDTCAAVISDGRIAGYISASAQCATLHTTVWPFYVNVPSAIVNNPIISDRLHLRQQPSQNARSLGRYYNGTIVTLLDNFDGRNEWTAVQIGSITGYMKSEYLDFSPAPNEHHSCLSLFEVHNPYAGTLHLRTQPDTIADSLGLFENGTLVAIIGFSGQWAHVICEGKIGFMMHQYLRTSIGTTFDPY